MPAHKNSFAVTCISHQDKIGSYQGSQSTRANSLIFDLINILAEDCFKAILKIIIALLEGFG